MLSNCIFQSILLIIAGYMRYSLLLILNLSTEYKLKRHKPLTSSVMRRLSCAVSDSGILCTAIENRIRYLAKIYGF